MKRLFFLSFLFLFCIGCGKIDLNFRFYEETVKKLNETNSFLEIENASLQVQVDRISDYELLYRLTLDQVQEEMNEVTLLVIHNQETEDVFPSIGIFDEKVSISPNMGSKGIILLGYIPYRGDITSFHATFLVYLSYYDMQDQFHEGCYQLQI